MKKEKYLIRQRINKRRGEITRERLKKNRNTRLHPKLKSGPKKKEPVIKPKQKKIGWFKRLIIKRKIRKWKRKNKNKQTLLEK